MAWVSLLYAVLGITSTTSGRPAAGLAMSGSAIVLAILAMRTPRQG